VRKDETPRCARCGLVHSLEHWLSETCPHARPADRRESADSDNPSIVRGTE
jgi:hypothetical protein